MGVYEIYVWDEKGGINQTIIASKKSPLEILEEKVKERKGGVFKAQIYEAITSMLSIPRVRYLSPIAAELENRFGEEFWKPFSEIENMILTYKYNLEKGKVPMKERERFYEVQVI